MSINTTKYILWVTVTGESGDVYYVTSDIHRTEYQLWHNGKLTWYKNSDPTELYQYCK